MTFDKKAFWAAIKEPLRILVLAILPFAFAWLTEFDYQWATAATLVLRFIDSYLHNVAKGEPAKTRNEGLLGEKGLTGF